MNQFPLNQQALPPEERLRSIERVVKDHVADMFSHNLSTGYKQFEYDASRNVLKETVFKDESKRVLVYDKTIGYDIAGNQTRWTETSYLENGAKVVRTTELGYNADGTVKYIKVV